MAITIDAEQLEDLLRGRGCIGIGTSGRQYKIDLTADAWAASPEINQVIAQDARDEKLEDKYGNAQ